MNSFKIIRFDLNYILLIAAILAFALSNKVVSGFERVRSIEEMKLAVPAAFQIIMAGGDKYLAANIAVFRAVTAGTHQFKDETYEILAKVQTSAAALNPRHEDNYYTAAAILAWNNQLDAAQEILTLATETRLNDALPPFFRGFNKYYFDTDYTGAAQDLLVAASRSTQTNQAAFTGIAAKWTERREDIEPAVEMLQRMKSATKDSNTQLILGARIDRLIGLKKLRLAASEFIKKNKRPPASLIEIVQSGLIAEIPADPFGFGFSLDPQGKPVLNNRPPQKPGNKKP